MRGTSQNLLLLVGRPFLAQTDFASRADQVPPQIMRKLWNVLVTTTSPCTKFRDLQSASPCHPHGCLSCRITSFNISLRYLQNSSRCFILILFQIAFAFHAAQSPGRLAQSVASLHLVRSTTATFSTSLRILYGNSLQITKQFESIKSAYTDQKASNVVIDGTVALPTHQVRSGVALELRYVEILTSSV